MNVFRKLRLTSRDELPAALAQDAPVSPSARSRVGWAEVVREPG
jgi:hypothetical protein